MKLRIPVREPQPPVREDYKNAAKFCKADRDVPRRARRSGEKYGTNSNGANAHGKCVSRQQLARPRNDRACGPATSEEVG